MREFEPERFETPRPARREYGVAAVPPDHFEWLVRRTGVNISPDFQAIAVMAMNEIDICLICGMRHPVVCGMLGYNDWTPNAVSIHLAFDDKRSIKTLKEIAFKYPFVQNERKMVFGLIRESNAAARRFAARQGFKEFARFPKAWSDTEDVIVFRLLREEWEAANGE